MKPHPLKVLAGVMLLLGCCANHGFGQTFEEVVSQMKPYAGQHRAGVGTSTLTGKVMCGYQSPEGAEKHGSTIMKPDVAWTKKNRLDYLPVAFPGFSWHNLRKSQGLNKKLGEIPRLNGRFLWSQAAAFKRAGARMLYVAMFDEIDEGTAIFKCTNTPPVGESRFLTYEGLPNDHYLWLTGKTGELMRGRIRATREPPARVSAAGQYP